MKHIYLFFLVSLTSLNILAQDEVNTRRLGANVPTTTEGVSVMTTPLPSGAQMPRRVVLDDDFNTEGTSFWLTFMQNYEYKVSSKALKMQLVFSSRNAANIKVSNPNTGWSTTSSVSANGVTIITVPTVQCYNAQAEMKFDYYGNTLGLRAYTTDAPQNTGLYIESTAPISVYGSNYASCTFDATNVLPTPSLGTDYVIQAYRTNKEGNTEFAIVATEDNTNVTIALSAPTLFNAKSTYTVHLNQGQVYMCVAEAAKGSLGGTVIQANKKIAVFNGDIDSYVPDNYGYCDHMCEQAMPVQTWGKKFVVTKTYGQNRDIVYFTAIKDGTTISKNGSVVATLNTCQHYSYNLTESAAYFETSEPCACYIYQTSRTANSSQLGDPSMVWITPQEQGIKQITFATFKTAVTQYHYVNVVVPTSAVSSMTLDGSPLTGFTTVPGNADYSYVCKKINHGTHTLYNDKEEFVAHVYGKGIDESYAYCVGGYVRKINDTDIEEIIEHETVSQTYDICEGQSVTIAGKEYSENAQVLDTVGTVIKKYTIVVHPSFLKEETREFKQGTSFTWHGQTISKPGTYKDEKVSKFGCDSIYKLIAKYDNVITTYDTICSTAFYKFRGESFALPTTSLPQDYTVKKTEGDWEYHMQLRILPAITYHNDTYVLEPEETYDYHGISISAPGDYTVNLTNVHGCDSIVTLKVTQPITTRTYATICEGESYSFGGQTYTVSGTFNNEVTASDGTKKVHQLVLTVVGAKHTTLDETICEGESYEKNGFHESKEGTYYLHLLSSEGCDSTVTLNLHICKPQAKTIEDSFCAGTTYSKYGFSATTPGTYVRALRNQYGCDSVVTLVLTENPSYHFTENITLVDDETQLWHGQTLNKKGTYTASYTTKAGCDSIYTANVRRIIGVEEELYDTLCEASTYTYRGQEFTIPTSDTYPFDFVMEVRDIMNCKRYRKILTIEGGAKYTETYELKPAETITFGTLTISEAGTYTQTFQNRHNCDSIVTLTVTQPVISYTALTEDICAGQGYIFVDGTTLTRPGTYIDSSYVAAKNGYEITQLTLNVRPTYEMVIDTTIEVGQTYVDNNFNKSEAGTYYAHLSTQYECDSTIILNLKVCSPVTKPLYETIIEGETYSRNGFTAYTTGTYTHTDISSTGCDSTTELHLTVLPLIMPTYIDSTICQGTTIEWEGAEYSEAGTYPKTFTLLDGRDSLRVFRLAVVPVYADTVYAEICQGETYTEYNFNETATGTYTQTLTSVGGCDSTMTVHLIVHPTYSQDIYETICHGDVYNKYGLSTNTPGDYVRRYTTEAGCDSILNIHISMNEPSMSVTQVTLKPGESYTWLGQTYTDTYYHCDTIVNAVGCDSVRIIDIFMDKYILTTIDTAFCEGDSIEIFGDTIVKTEGFYMRTYELPSGSDSIVTWAVSVKLRTDSLTKVVLHKGETITWHGVTYDLPVTKHDTLVNAAGCDSICTLELTYDDIVVSRTPIEFCQGDSAKLWNDSIVKTEGTYQRKYPSYIAGIDSLSIYDVTVLMPTDSNTVATINKGESYIWHGKTYTEPTFVRDTLRNAAGCDSICTLTLNVIGLSYQDSAYICENEIESFTWEGETFTKDNLVRMKTFPTEHGDSTVIFTLHLYPVKHTDTDIQIRQGQTYPWHGKVYSGDTIVVDTLRSIHDCDSICTLSLTILPPPSVRDSDYVCENRLSEFTWQGEHFTKTKLTITKTLTTELGDSIVTFTVKLLLTASSSQDTLVCSNELPYTWHGLVFRTFGSQQKTYQAANGCDSVVTYSVRLKECEVPCVPLQTYVSVDTVCADAAYISLTTHILQGKIASSAVQFSAAAKSAGFRDTMATVPQDGQIRIPLPRLADSTRYPRPDTYAMFLTLRDTCGNTRIDTLSFLVLYPSWIIVQRWNDVLALYNDRYNGGYTFSNIRWFNRNGLIEGSGEHNSYIYVLPNLAYGEPYWAELTRLGESQAIRTCNCIPHPSSDGTSFAPLRLVPRRGGDSRVWQVETSMSGQYSIFSVAGQRLGSGYFGEEYKNPDIVLSNYATGTYVVSFMSNDGKSVTQKIMVHD